VKGALRVVLDTNVVLSALVFAGGRAGAVRGLWQSARVVPLASAATAAELARALVYPKFGLNADEREALLAEYLPWCESVRVPARGMRVPACRDPDDRAFLELAVAGAADALVSGDRDLLVLRGQVGFEILDVNGLLRIVDVAG
jgi:putative PIN family toxin of toxin-antitoxin system